MQKGIFKSFRHEHVFKESNNQILMIDVFEYKSPYGILADWLFLRKYMTNLLYKRNILLKDRAEQ